MSFVVKAGLLEDNYAPNRTPTSCQELAMHNLSIISKRITRDAIKGGENTLRHYHQQIPYQERDSDIFPEFT
jgi:hypothetical protein